MPLDNVNPNFTYPTYNPAFPFATTLSTRPDTGPDGVAGTADDRTLQYYNRLSATNLTVVTNDPTSLQAYTACTTPSTTTVSTMCERAAEP